MTKLQALVDNCTTGLTAAGFPVKPVMEGDSYRIAIQAPDGVEAAYKLTHNGRNGTEVLLLMPDGTEPKVAQGFFLYDEESDPELATRRLLREVAEPYIQRKMRTLSATDLMVTMYDQDQYPKGYFGLELNTAYEPVRTRETMERPLTKAGMEDMAGSLVRAVERARLAMQQEEKDKDFLVTLSNDGLKAHQVAKPGKAFRAQLTYEASVSAGPDGLVYAYAPFLEVRSDTHVRVVGIKDDRVVEGTAVKGEMDMWATILVDVPEADVTPNEHGGDELEVA